MVRSLLRTIGIPQMRVVRRDVYRNMPLMLIDDRLSRAPAVPPAWQILRRILARARMTARTISPAWGYPLTRRPHGVVVSPMLSMVHHCHPCVLHYGTMLQIVSSK